MNEHSVRDLRPDNIRVLSEQINVKRAEFLQKAEMVLRETQHFASVVSNAIGEISLSEAREGLIDYFTEGMRQK